MKRLFSIVLLACRMSWCAQAQQPSTTAPSKNIHITCAMPLLKEGDSIPLYLKRYDDGLLRSSGQYHALVRNHEFSINIPADLPFQYIGFLYPHESKPGWNRMTGDLLAGPGDDIRITADHGKLAFSGRGAAKMEIGQELARMDEAWSRKFNYDFRSTERYFDPAGIRANFMWQDSLAWQELHYLRSHRKDLTTREYKILEAGVLVQNECMKWGGFHGEDNAERIKALTTYHDPAADRLFASAVRDNPDMVCSGYYFEAFFDKYIYDQCNGDRSRFRARPCYDRILADFSGPMREKMAACLINRRRAGTEDLTEMVDDAMSWTRIAEFQDLLTDLKANLSGAEAFNFSLQDTTGKVWHLSDLHGKVVIIDFWYNGCGSCRNVYPYVKTLEEKYRGNPGVVFVSMILPSPRQVWLDGINGGKYTSPEILNLWLDPKDGIDDAHPVIHHYHVGAYPTLVMIDPEGRLMVPPVHPDIDHGADIDGKISSAFKKS